MIDKFGVKNFKAFKDKVELDIKPLTILTGTNSSGKSSFTQALRLYNKIDKIQTNSGLHLKIGFNEELALLGDFNSVRYSSQEPIVFTRPATWPGLEDQMKIEVGFCVDSKRQAPSGELCFFRLITENGELVFEYKIVGSEIKSVSHKYGGDSVQESLKTDRFINILYLRERFDRIYEELIEFKHSLERLTRFFSIMGKEDDFILNNYRAEIKTFYESLETNEDLDKDFDCFMNYTADMTSESFYETDNKFWDFRNKLVNGNYLYNFVDKKRNTKTISKYMPNSTLMEYLVNGKPPNELQQNKLIEYELQKKVWLSKGLVCDFYDLTFGRGFGYLFGDGYMEWEKQIEKELALDSVEIREGINYKVFLEGFVGKGLDFVVKNYFLNFIDTPIEYIPSIRTIPARFLSRSNMNTYLERLVNSLKVPHKNDQDKLNFWINEFGISDKMEVFSVNQIGVSQIRFVKNSKQLNLSDVGYGVSQLIPILIRLCLYDDKMIMIEEPETNLHPALQSKLADFLVSCMNKNKRIIIETHSEFLIRKLQYLVAKKEVKSEDCVIYYFNADENVSENEAKIKKIKITDEGNLTDNFGPGFFDEATRLQFELLKLNRNQSN